MEQYLAASSFLQLSFGRRTISCSNPLTRPLVLGVTFFPASLARDIGFRVLKDAVLLASDKGDPMILHVSLMPPDGTPLDTVLDWVSEIEAASTGCICAMKAAAEPRRDDDGAASPTSPLPWASLAAASLLPVTAARHQPCIVGPLGTSATSSATKLHLSASIDDRVDTSVAWDSDEVVHTTPVPASDAREEVA